MSKPGIAEIVQDIQQDVSALVHDEIELAKAEIAPQIKRAGAGIGMFSAAGYLLFTALGLGFAAGSLGLAFGYRTWFGWDELAAAAVGFASTAVLFLLLAGIFALAAKGKFSFTVPEKAITSSQESVAAIKESAARGKVNRGQPERAAGGPEQQPGSAG
jgi:hypothetical protein